MFCDVHEEIIRYVMILQQIALYKVDSGDYFSPYQLEQNRQIAHKKLFDNVILPMCNPVDGFDECDMYNRTREIFSNLDKVWKIYDGTEFNLEDDNCAQWLMIYIDKFIHTTETIYFIEGRTNYIHGIHI